MPNTVHHRIGAGLVGATVAAVAWRDGDHAAKHPLTAGVAMAACATLPDWLEPAVHPHHRQFFHSALFLAGLGYGMYWLAMTEPKTDSQRWLKYLSLMMVGATAVHLVMDAATPRSLPWVGK